MFPQRHVRFTARLLEPLERLGLLRVVAAVGDGVDEVVRQHEGHPLPVDAELLLVVAEEVSEVYVEDLTVLVDHDVVRVPVPDPEDEGCHAVARTRVGECFYSLLQLVFVVF